MSNMSNIARKTLKIKEIFPSLQNKKIKIMQKIISGNDKQKLCLNMTTKGPLWKQVIIPMKADNVTTFVKNSSMYIIDINRILKGIKLNIMADYICYNNKSIIIATNNIASLLDLQAIERYIKSLVCIEVEHIKAPRLPQSKLYLKIIRVPYLSEQSNSQITSEDIEKILRSNHIFNDVVLTSKPRIIKISPKLDMSIIWINIWDAQSRSKAKSLINRRFNVRSFIITIHGMNMNPSVPQCKNCWK